MALIVPHRDFPMREMLSQMSGLTQKGNMKIAEAQARATDEVLKEVFVAGYAQCMKDFGITSVTKMVEEPEGASSGLITEAS